VIIKLLACTIVVSFGAWNAASADDSNDTAAAEYKEYVMKQNIPRWIQNVFYKKKLTDEFDFSFKINPLYLRGDFNGDSDPDIAIFVTEKSSGKLGIIVFHHDSGDFYVLGAGDAVGNGGDDFVWMTNWTVRRNEVVDMGASMKPSPTLKGEALLVEKAESASGIIYWDGEQYLWYQQGD